MTLSLSSYSKVFVLGHRAVQDILSYPVIVEEKIDGSQFSFGLHNGELLLKSKGTVIHHDNIPNLFAPAVDTACYLHRDGLLVEGSTYRAEALYRNRHNVLTYDQVPAAGMVLYDVMVGLESYLSRVELEEYADHMGIPIVPKLWGPGMLTEETFQQLLQTESFLGGTPVEGVVIKVAARNAFGIDGKPLVAKFVSEAFKEKHDTAWGKKQRSQSSIKDGIVAALRTDARWQKAVSALRDAGTLAGEPSDIGLLLKTIQQDVAEEEADWIKEQLYKAYRKDILRGICHGFANWYKQSLASVAFDAAEASVQGRTDGVDGDGDVGAPRRRDVSVGSSVGADVD